MPEFSYIVRTQDGSRKEGVISAENYNVATEELLKKQHVVLKLQEKDNSNSLSFIIFIKKKC